MKGLLDIVSRYVMGDFLVYTVKIALRIRAIPIAIAMIIAAFPVHLQIKRGIRHLHSDIVFTPEE